MPGQSFGGSQSYLSFCQVKVRSCYFRYGIFHILVAIIFIQSNENLSAIQAIWEITIHVQMKRSYFSAGVEGENLKQKVTHVSHLFAGDWHTL